MKALFTCILVFMVNGTSTAQNQNLETQSVALDNLISFIANSYPVQLDESHIDYDEDDVISRNITFLIETSYQNPSMEDALILKQAFKFLSKRLKSTDHISIFTYSGMNGLLLNKSSPIKLKKILYVINDFKSNIDKIDNDGITQAYTYASENYENSAINSVVMIRNPNAIVHRKIQHSTVEANTELPKQKNNVLLLTAITLLPEIISIIKD